MNASVAATDQRKEAVEVRVVAAKSWSAVQAFTLALVCLLVGICAGSAIRWTTKKTTPPLVPAAAVTAEASVPQAMPNNLNPIAIQPSAEDIKRAADSQAAPLLEQLKIDSANATILAQLGNIYYDTKQYPIAIDYYERSLKSQPSNTSVRTDLGTSYWYNGDPDKAIAEFNKALTYEPAKPDTLFNLGIVEWKGKKDPKAAIAAWQKLLATNPGYENKPQVENLIAQARNQ